MNKLTFFFAGLLLVPLILDQAYAQQIVNEGPDYRTISNFDGSFTYETLPLRLHDGITWQSFILFEDSNLIQVETGQGSYQIDKNTCEFSFWKRGFISGNPIIPSDTYLARQSSDAVIWNEVSQINNAACQTAVIISGDDIEIQTIKSHALGEMKIRYIKEAGRDLKSQMEVTNTSGLNDRYFSFFQIMQVPQLINFGGNQIDLATKNGTFYDRDFIINNKAKLVTLSEKVGYDFDKGFSNLLGITVLYDGVNTFLEFDYSNNAQILPDGETFVVDPVFTDSAGSVKGVRDNLGSGANCAGISVAFSDLRRLELHNTAFTDSCRYFGIQFNTTALDIIEPSITIRDVNMIFDVTLETFTPTVRDCDYVILELNQTGLTHAQLRTGLVPPAATYGEDDGTCRGVSNDKVENFTGTPDMLTAVISNIQENVDDDEGFWPIGIMMTDYPDRSNCDCFRYFANFRLSITYDIDGGPDAVTDLIAGNTTGVTTDLAWSEPFLNGTLSGYQINFTTPHGSPRTTIINDTGTNITRFMVSGLNQNTDYSFRVAVWTNVTNNATGNIANITTIALGNVTVGFVDIDAVNLDFRTWKFERTDLNSSAYSLSVIYPEAFNATCSFHFKFAMIDQNFSNLPTTETGLGELEAIFTFNNTASEVIDVLCIDENDSTNPEGIFLLTQSNFLLLQQLEEFRDGTYGTMGNIGSIDLITVVGIIIAMIGFNRVNESVGYFFLIAILGALAFFSIIQWPVALLGIILVVGVLTYTSTRKPG